MLTALKAELFFVNLDWQLIPGVASQELPQRLYVFVEDIPVSGHGHISKPAVFWSLFPDRITTNIPEGFRWEAWFTARGSGRSWELPHYDAARGGAYEGLDVEALGFPKYEVSALAISDK